MASYSKIIGKRTILGTDWPVENIVERREKFGKAYWNVAFAVCNGVPARGENFKTKKAAFKAAGIREE